VQSEPSVSPGVGEESSQSAYSAARMLAALDTHGPKVAVYLLAAQLLGVFEWMSANAPGVCG
jgi:hypothetical protein